MALASSPALLPRLALAIGLAILTACLAGAAGRAEEAAGPVPREEMVEALIDFARSRGCETRRRVFGPRFGATCGRPDADEGEIGSMWLLLEEMTDAGLIGLCRRNGVLDCERPQEVSTGRPVLAFESAVDLDFNATRAIFSPDGRLLLDGLNLPAAEVRLLDVASGRLLDPPLYSGPIHDAAWSPDGAFIALSGRKRAAAGRAVPVGAIRLYDAGTLKAVGRISAADIGCTLGLLEGMAFTADSRSLWVLCAQADKTARAMRLSVPGLGVEDSLAPASPDPKGLPEVHWEEGIQRHGEDLIATVRFRSPPPGRGPRPLVQSYSLRTKVPLHAPIPASAGPARLASDLSGVYVGDELWSTRTGQRAAVGVVPAGRYLGAPGRIPGPALGLRVEARPLTGSRRWALAVVDVATGATVQELGPVPPVVGVVVAPGGERVAVAGFRGVRFYRVRRDGGGQPP
jgi:hypothetical protein